MALKKKPVTGMKDIMPAEMEIRDYVIGLIKDFFKALVSGDTVFLNGFSESLKTALSDLGSYIAAKTSNWVLLAVAAALTLLIFALV